MNEFAIHDATRKGDLCRVIQLIVAGVSVNSLNEEGNTPLHSAVLYGRYEVAALLIHNKCSINLKDRIGRTPVIRAAVDGKKDIADLLLHRGAQVNCVDDDGRTFLHWVSSNTCWTDIVRLILDSGEADLNAADICGSTPLMHAIRGVVPRGSEEVAALIIRAGADVNRSDVEKNTALHWAIRRGRARVIQILLEKEGLDLSPQDVNGNTPLHLACGNYFWREISKQLLDAGTDINLKNNQGRTALSEGIRSGNFTHEDIRLFVHRGAFLEKCDYECIYQNPLLKDLLKDVEFCTQSIVNKFHRQSLPSLNSIPYFARRLPNVDSFKLGARHIDEVETLVKCEIERNTFRNVVKVHPIALGALCVLSLITCKK